MAAYNTILTLDTYIGTETYAGGAGTVSWASNSNIVSTPTSYAKVEKLGASVYDTGGNGTSIRYDSEWITAKKSDMSAIPDNLKITRIRFLVDYDIIFTNLVQIQAFYSSNIFVVLGASKTSTKPGGSGNTGTQYLGVDKPGIVIYGTYQTTSADQTSGWLSPGSGALSQLNVSNGADLKDSNFRVFARGELNMLNGGTNYPDLTLKVSKLRLEIEGNVPARLLQVTSFY